MRLPRRPPNWLDIFKEHGPAVISLNLRATQLNRERYLHWDDLRRRPLEEGETHEQLWAATKLARAGQQRFVPLLDANRNPFRFVYADAVLRLLHDMDGQARGELKSDFPELSGQLKDVYLLRSVAEESINSSLMEGASTTRKQAKDLLRSGREPRDEGERMVLNNYLGMMAVQRMVDEPLSVERILDLHKVVCENTLDDPDALGRIRREDEVVEVVARDDNTVVHTPPDAGTLVDHLHTLCAFANATSQGDNDTQFVHPLIRAILLHFMIGYLHPFVDGNGRVARLLFYWSALRQGYWLIEFLSISNILRKAPSQYVRSYLHTDTDEGDCTYFILHQLETLSTATDQLKDWLARQQKSLDDVIELLAKNQALGKQLNHRQIDLLRRALKNSGEQFNIRSHQKEHGVVQQTARMDLLKLVELDLLHRYKIGKQFVFRAPSDLLARMRNV